MMADLVHPAENNLCHYPNSTNQLQVARINNIPNWSFERVVFPMENMLFEAPSEAALEIYTGKLANVVLVDRIPCEHLKVESDGEV